MGEKNVELLLLPDEGNQEAILSPEAIISALLFVSTRPLDEEKLQQLSRLSAEEVELALKSIQEKLNSESWGIALTEVNGAWQIRTLPTAKKFIRELIPPKAKRLSRAALETLAVIAYKQPVQRSEIETIRGVDALPTLKTLLEARLVRIVGRENAVGQPTLYGTTSEFLERFGLKDLAELPNIKELAQFAGAEDPGEKEYETEKAISAENNKRSNDQNTEALLN